jgi:cutinase
MSARLLSAAVLAASPLLTVAAPAAAAECSDVQVVFARGTGEGPGVGAVGQAFVDALRPMVGGRSLGVYGVNYPASNDFGPSMAAGVSDASGGVQYVAANCPNTRIVLGGYSQGAAVIDAITSPAFDSGVQLPPDVADHVAAVAVFGNPSITMAGGPLTAISPLYGSKTIDLCFPLDPICTPGSPLGLAHVLYVPTGMPAQAASFAAGRL